jgi:uncharacterized protein YjiS (DUF1127 family)
MLRLLLRFIRFLLVLQETRARLARLDDHLLADIGTSRADIPRFARAHTRVDIAARFAGEADDCPEPWSASCDRQPST